MADQSLYYAKLTYNANGTYVSGVPGASMYSTVNSGGSVTGYVSTARPTRTYFTFNGWALSSSASSGMSGGAALSLTAATTKGTGNARNYNLYATWQHVNVTCTFNANGGSGAPAAITHWGGYSIDIPNTIPTRSGYTFLGWAKESTATSALYTAGQQNVALYDNITLYAVWKRSNSIISSVTSSVPIDGVTQGTVSINRYVSSYKHTVTIALSSTLKQEFTNVDTSVNFTIPTSWLSGVPNATSASVTVTLKTMDGSTQIGNTDSKTFTITVPSNIVPTISSVSETFVNDNATVDGWNILLQGYSKLRLNAVATAGTGASISSYEFSGLGMSYVGANAYAVSNVLSEAGNKTWTVKVTDSRGRTDTRTVTFTVYEYSVPSVLSFVAERSDSAGVKDDVSGTYLHAMSKYAYASANGNNSVTATISYRLHDSQTWITGQSNVVSETWYTFGNGGIDIDKAFVIKIELTDLLNNSVTYVVEVQSVVGYSFGLKNDRVRFGGVVQKPGFQNDLALEQNGDAVFNANVDIANRRCHARLNSAGWYRAIKIASEGRGGMGFVLDINITRSYSNASNEVHKIHLLGCWNNFVFVDETSRSNALRVAKIRYTRDSEYNGYVDIYFNSSNFEIVSVDFAPHTQSDYMYEITAESLQAVGDAPSGETVLTTYNLLANTDRSLTVTNSNCTARFYAVGGVKAVRISNPKGLTANAVTTLVSASEMADYMPVGSYVQDCVSMNSAMERVRFYVDSSGIRAYNYSTNTGTLNMELTITYV